MVNQLTENQQDGRWGYSDGAFGEEAELSLKDIYFVLRRNARVIFMVTGIVLVVTAVVTLLAIPVYESTAMIMVEKPNQAMSVFQFGLGEEINLLNNEMEILKSRTLGEAAVDYLWQSRHRNNLFLFGTRMYEPEGIRRIFRKVVTFGLWAPDSSALLRYSGSIPDSVKTAAVENIRGAMEVTNERNTNVLKLTMSSNSPEEAALLTNTVVQLYQQRDQEWTAGEIINLKDFLEEQLQKTEGELAIVEDSLKSFQEKEQIYELAGNANVLLEQLADIEKEYYRAVAEVNIVKERKRYAMGQLSEEEKRLTERVLNSLNSRLEALRMEIAQNEADLVRNASLYGEKHDIVRTIQTKIKKLKRELELQTDYLIAQGISTADPIKYRQSLMDTVLTYNATEASLEARSGEYKKLVDQYNAQLNQLPAKSLQFARLERDRRVLAETYSLMRQKLEEARISQASKLGKIRIIDPAIPPEHRTKPKTKLNMLLGLILGTGLGIGGAFLLEYLDNTVKSVEDIERRSLTLLGIIPAIGAERYDRKKKRAKVQDKSEGNIRQPGEGADGEKSNTHERSNRKKEVDRLRRRLITHEDPKSPISEAYRSLRTSLMYSTADKEIKSILVSSPGPGDGKTTTVANLAIAYANLGKRTLLLDTDLRRPVIHRLFGLSRDPGITQYLSGVVEDFEELIQETDVENLFVVTSGIAPPNPSELLGSQKMINMVGRLEKEWDIVLMDSPPVVAVTDATMISKEIDRIIMVVKSGSTDKAALNRSLLALHNVDAPLGGVVLNAVSSKNSYGSYYYYYQYYYYHGSD